MRAAARSERHGGPRVYRVGASTPTLHNLQGKTHIPVAASLGAASGAENPHSNHSCWCPPAASVLEPSRVMAGPGAQPIDQPCAPRNRIDRISLVNNGQSGRSRFLPARTSPGVCRALCRPRGSNRRRWDGTHRLQPPFPNTGGPGTMIHRQAGLATTSQPSGRIRC